MKKILIVAGVVVLLAVGGGAYVYMQKKTEGPQTVNIPIVDSTIQEKEDPLVVATSTLSKAPKEAEIIRQSIIAYNSKRYPPNPYSSLDVLNIELLLVGGKYVLYNIPNSKIEGGVSIANIFDLTQQKDVGVINASFVLKNPTMFLYTDGTSICTYKVDTNACVLIQDTVLPNGEEYWDPMGNSVEVVSQSNSSFTVTVYSGYEIKSREATYSLSK